MPDNFYSTTNNNTQIFHRGKWIKVDNMMMDKCIVVKGNTAKCVPILDIKKGDKIIVDERCNFRNWFWLRFSETSNMSFLNYWFNRF